MCSPGHYMNDCPRWKKEQPVAAYMGSAVKGLWFYHLDLPEDYKVAKHSKLWGGGDQEG
jgi:hypothetical protein